MSRALLKVENLSVDFGPVSNPIRVLNDVSFSVGRGQAVGLVGESGSGKSITSLSILRLVPEPPGHIAAGRVEFDGCDLLKLPRNKMPEIRGRDIAMIFQEPMSSLNPVMAIGDQIGEAIKLHRALDSSRRRERVIELLKLVGMPDPVSRLGSYPHQFSGGMRQRVMIAMALACDPKLLIADEPTTALDVTIQAQVLELMKKIRSEVNSSILLISHDLGVIADICDRVVVMYAGRVVEDGDVKSIFRTPKHPYTQGLLQAVPRLADDRERLYQIAGSVPAAGSIKQGCPFFARCSLRQNRCQEQMPPMFQFGSEHSAACWVTAEEEVS
ncbi:ABC transporter ATP-binding protein [Pelagibacterium lentulum]|uniref:ABC transporter ATP-binding protein n=2 Tax=Pelagibacterium lentulum TaxID=2029865 RepID=A0A916R9D3_9HYPH|nr:ABC transporter ATP-binding protein [Pelagibacterium lentulum]GGA43272.1 ABC transporter ATP-binding protein [Pelagibacterium lentulum]